MRLAQGLHKGLHGDGMGILWSGKGGGGMRLAWGDTGAAQG